MCTTHYRRYRVTGTAADPVTKDPLDRFWEKVRDVDECWIWIGSKSSLGYGHFTIGKKLFLAHRWLYEVLIGPIPEGLTLDHLCRQPSCVRPGHLEPVTSKENTLRGISPAAMNALKTHCKQGHPFEGDNVFLNNRGERQCRTCVRARELAYRKRYRAAVLGGTSFSP